MTAAAVSGTPALVPAILYLSAELENVPARARTAAEVKHLQLAKELTSLASGLEFYASTQADGSTAFDLVSTCCQVPVGGLPADEGDLVRCPACNRVHGIARHAEALGAWLVVDQQRQKRPLNRHQRRRIEKELAGLRNLAAEQSAVDARA